MSDCDTPTTDSADEQQQAHAEPFLELIVGGVALASMTRVTYERLPLWIQKRAYDWMTVHKRD